jgi:formylglycine-generating enzyme required for sulfatase activity
MKASPTSCAIGALLLGWCAGTACSTTPAARSEGGAGGSGGGPGGGAGTGAAEMVSVPAGSFMMGCNSAVDTSCNPDESPYHSVYLDAFSIDKTEVTQAAYSSCIAAGTCLAIQGLPSDQVPVHDMTLANAMDYCAWVGERLPTEAEWEKAARGTDGRIYPWGNDAPTCDLAVFGTCASAPAAVGGRSAGASPYGALDMAGNVAEWVADLYAADYYQSSPDSDPTGPTTGTDHVDRGGWYRSSAAQVRVSFREANSADTAIDYVGFRCAR